jgi:hypothetical protein
MQSSSLETSYFCSSTLHRATQSPVTSSLPQRGQIILTLAMSGLLLGGGVRHVSVDVDASVDHVAVEPGGEAVCDAVVGDRDGVGLSVGALVGDEEEARSRRGPGRGGHHEASPIFEANFARCSAARSAAFVCILDGRLDPWKGQVGGI